MTKPIFYKRKPRWGLRILILLLLPVIGFVLYPSPIDPVAWSPPKDDGYVGAYAPNDLLLKAERIALKLGKGPEDISVAPDGTVYTGYDNGTFYKISPDGVETRLRETGGRAIGHDLDADGNLIIADSTAGLVKINTQTNTLEVLATASDGVLFGFADDVDVAPDGRIYFSDASFAHGPEELKYDVLEAKPNGRLLRYDPVTGMTETLLDGLYFANGIAVSGDGSFVLVNETTRYRMQRYWISGPKAGTSEIILENLPGFPDGVSYDGQGGFWLALYSPRSAELDKMHPSPFIKKLVAKLPEGLSPEAAGAGTIVHLNADLVIDGVYHDLTGKHARFTTSVEQIGDVIYIGNLSEPYFHRINVNELR